MNNLNKYISRVAFSLLIATLSVGCAQQLDDIDRVQNNVTEKAELKGEFRWN